ncbi:ESF1 homolog [Lutzomyia longipalpis]|uniref:ESF1 homolog n=1 Tax=Lutzomyia longipalpis TaxID=7200 RepID=UPI002483C158|nr:ESF1 homolog [Lutzomyia longipalpis]
MEKSKKDEKMGKDSAKESEIWKDPRFSHLVNDPRFKNISESRRKVKIDRRFQSMFKDPKFSLKYTVDKYGRRVEKDQSDALKKYYALSDDEEEDEKAQEAKEESGEEDSSDDENDDLEVGEKIDKKMKKRLKDLEVDYARGEANILTDSSSDDESSEDDEEEVTFDHVWGELDNDAPRTDESTRRIAACNMDWDKMRAVDIMVLCNSFLPEGGRIEKVSIYPSEFGKERMREEDMKGPAELLAENWEDTEDGAVVKDSKERDLEGDSYHMEKLRQYQLNRLKYFYAVIECDSVRTADALYAECDGLEYESSATRMDLRFIPDDMDFDDEPHDVCSKLPNLQEYKPRLFETSALQKSKVNLTWDDTSVERKEFNEKIAQGRLKEVSQEDLKRFITYSSEEEDDEDTEAPSQKADELNEESGSDESEGEESQKASIEKYKLLLSEINEQEKRKKEDKIERELSWGVMVGKDDDQEDADESSGDNNPSLTPFERLVEKKKQKQKKRREEIKKKLKGGESEDESSEDDIPDGIDMNDPYFAEEFANGNFAPPKNTKKAQKERKERLAEEKAAQEEEEKQNAELALLLDDQEEGKSHFSLKKIQNAEMETKKRKRKKLLKKSKAEIAEAKAKKAQEDDFQINVNDERFSAVFSSHFFNIDPTDPSFKKTKAMDKLIEEKLKRKQEPGKFPDEEQSAKRSKKDAEVSVLVKSIKRKVKNK